MEPLGDVLRTALAIRLIPLAGLCVVAAFVISCSGSKSAVAPAKQPLIYSVSVTGGNNQKAPISTELPADIVVSVEQQSGSGLAGPVATGAVRVSWNPGANSGSVAASVTATDPTGASHQQWTLGTAVGAQSLAVRVLDATTDSELASTNVAATGTPLPVDTTYSLTLLSGNLQTTGPGDPLSTAVTVLASQQIGTAPAVPIAAGRANLTWNPSSGGSVSLTSSQPGANGQGVNAWTLGNVIGSQTLSVTLLDAHTGAVLSTATFTATAATPVYQFTNTSFDNVSITPGVPYNLALHFAWLVTDQFGLLHTAAPIGITAVVWTDTNFDPPEVGDPQCAVSGTVLTCASAIKNTVNGQVLGVYLVEPTPPAIPALQALSPPVSLAIATSDEIANSAVLRVRGRLQGTGRVSR